MEHLLEIETAMGRVRKERWGPRNIDLDLLLFDNEIIETEDLKVPHPRMHLRRFVLAPLVQLAPDLVHPLFLMTVTQLLGKLPEAEQTIKTIKEA